MRKIITIQKKRKEQRYEGKGTQVERGERIKVKNWFWGNLRKLINPQERECKLAVSEMKDEMLPRL